MSVFELPTKRKKLNINSQLDNSDTDNINYADQLEESMKSTIVRTVDIGRLISKGLLNKSINSISLTEIEKRVSNYEQTPFEDIVDLDFARNVERRRSMLFKECTKRAISILSKDVKELPHGLRLKGQILNASHYTSSADPFEKIFLNDVYEKHKIVGGDLCSQLKALVRDILKTITTPKLCIWKYSNASCSSKEPLFLKFPPIILRQIEEFIYDSLGIFIPPQFATIVDVEDETLTNSSFFTMLASNHELRRGEFTRRQHSRMRMSPHIEGIIAKSLNYLREWHYDAAEKELKPCRIKGEHNGHLTWRDWQEAAKDPARLEAFHFFSEYILNTERTSYANTERTSYANTERTSYANTERTSYANTERTPYVNTARTSYANTERTSYANTERTSYANTERTPYVNTARTSYANTERTSYANTERTSYANTERTLYANTARTSYANTERTLYANTARTENGVRLVSAWRLHFSSAR
ncbi:unnamed protein product [Caenorhabditis bovis]|uniref:Uncharacterized protein n=1 Tax=Caenorhabditis bovis TaxID=2654633 RepID=A0A8S1FD17_9PELO|nr:unnamed protein product [Caenorhabditis bovis]